MTFNKIRAFIFENYYKGIRSSKESSYYSMKHHKKKDLLQTIVCKKLTEKKIPDCCDTKEYYQSFLRKKNTKLVKQSKMITQQPNFWKIQNC